MTLARRAGTAQKQISRIERGDVSPSVSTVSRLLAAVGERLELRAVCGPRDNRCDDELRADFEELTASERIAQTAVLSCTLTGIAAGGRAVSVGGGARADHLGQRSGLRPVPLQAEPMLCVLAEHRVDFVIIGAFALSAHGVIRGTKDIDIVPNPQSENITRLAAALCALSAEVMLTEDVEPSELRLAPDETGLSLGGNWFLGTRMGRLDVMQDVAGTKSYGALRAAAVERDVPSAGPFWFCGLDDLIAMKVAAARPQDELDIATLQRARRRAHQ